MKASTSAQRSARKLFKLAMGSGELDAGIAKKVVGKLGEAKPRGYLGIISAFSRLVRLEVERHHAIVESAAPLDDATQSTVRADLVKKYGSQLTVDFQVKPELLGGIRAKVGSDVWDGSVKNRLDRLNEAFG